jgi:hypothetical protein
VIDELVDKKGRELHISQRFEGQIDFNNTPFSFMLPIKNVEYKSFYANAFNNFENNLQSARINFDGFIHIHGLSPIKSNCIN